MREYLDKHFELPAILFGLGYHLFQREKRKRLNQLIKLPSFDLIRESYPRKSSTLFILGSGASINSISDSMWNTIDQHDSVGINFWVLHDYVPSILNFELSSDHNDERARMFLEVLHARAHDYDQSVLLCNNRSKDEDIVKILGQFINSGNIYYPNYVTAPGYSQKSLEKSLRWINAFNQRYDKHIFTFKRSSLSMIVSMASLLGYKNVVLCGIDLNNVKYFYDDPYYSNRYPKIYSGQTRRIHKTNDSELHPITIQSVLSAIKHIMYEPSGFKLYVLSKESALYPMLPKYAQ